MAMQIRLRKAVETDWPAILEVVNVAVPWAPRDNQQWLSNRMRFDQTGYVRRHYVALDATTGNVIGYGAVEGGQEFDRYRIFVIVFPDMLISGAGDILYDQLMADLSALHARVVWTHEYANDDDLLGFLSRHGFSEMSRFPLPDSSEEAVVMEKQV